MSKPDDRLLFALLIYGSEARLRASSPAEQQLILARQAELRAELAATASLGPVLRLEPHRPTTLSPSGEPTLLADTPFAEGKEQLIGIHVLAVASQTEALAAAHRLWSEGCAVEIRPVAGFDPGQIPARQPDA